MFETVYIHISDTLAVGPVDVIMLNDVRRRIYSHPQYDNQAMIASILLPEGSTAISVDELEEDV